MSTAGHSLSTSAEREESETAARQHVHAVVAGAGSSFYWGMRILPREKREAMYAIYAFCRAVDDVADSVAAAEEKLAALQDWRREVEQLFAGRPEQLTTQALLPALSRFDLPQAEFLAMIEGMEMDARAPVLAPPMDDLRHYCRCVAGSVGQLAVRVFGDPSPAAQSLAVAEGEALQLTNILRDVAEDARRGRIYLPAEALDQAGVATRDPASLLADPGLSEACRTLAATARQRFVEARNLLNQCDRGRLRPAVIMLENYSRLLDLLELRGWERIGERVRVSRPEKLWIALRHGFF